VGSKATVIFARKYASMSRKPISPGQIAKSTAEKRGRSGAFLRHGCSAPPVL